MVGFKKSFLLFTKILFLSCFLTACFAKKQDNSYEFEIERAIARSTATTPAKKEVAPLPPPRDKNEVAPGYLVKISNVADKHLQGKFRVDFDGNLILPYDVTVNVAGKSVNELERAVNDAYRPYFVGTPDLTVTILERERYVDVGGLVSKPGRFLVNEKSTVDELVAQAGGLLPATGNAGEYAAKYVNITQSGMSRLVRLSEYYAGDRSLIPAWRGGDKVFFQSEGADSSSAVAATRNYIQVLGQVHAPGEYPYEDGADFIFYLSKAGGPNEKADLEKMEIIRVENGERRSFVFKMQDVKQVPVIRGGDIIVVHADKPSGFISNVTSVMGAIATSVLAGAAL